MDEEDTCLHFQAANVADAHTLLYLITLVVPYGYQHVEMSSKGLTNFVQTPAEDTAGAHDGGHSATTYDLLMNVISGILQKADAQYPGIKDVDPETVNVMHFQVLPNDIRAFLGR